MTTSTMTEETKNNLAGAYNRASDAACATANSIKENAKSEYYARKADVEMMAGKASSAVAERPLVSIGIAFAAGCLLSRLLK